MNALQKLIADHLEAWPDENFSTIARRGGLPRQTVQALARRAVVVEPPRARTIEKLARGLGLPVQAVRAAAGAAAGFIGHDDTTNETIDSC